MVKLGLYKDTQAKQFDSDIVKGVTGRVAIGKADGARNFCMRVFEIKEGGYTPKHSHDWEHEIFVHAGKGEVFSDGQWIPFQAGYTVFIPSNETHQIRNASDVPLVFVCLIPSGAPEL